MKTVLTEGQVAQSSVFRVLSKQNPETTGSVMRVMGEDKSIAKS